MAASAIAYDERKQAWITFFAWVKKNVPSFNPKCIVTDGATYINSAYVEATDNHPVLLVAQEKNGSRKERCSTNCGAENSGSSLWSIYGRSRREV